MRDRISAVRHMDWLMFWAMLILLLVSASILYSLNLNIGGSDFLVFRKQIIFIIAGLVLFFLTAGVNYKVWSTFSKLIYILFIAVLVLVLFLGTEIKGTTGWIILGPLSLQPVEFAKLGLIIWLARYFADHAKEFYMFRHIFISGFGTAVYVGLVLLQPDLGSALVLVGAWLFMLLFTGIKRKHLVWLGVAFVVVAVVAWIFLLKPYMKARIMTFIDPGLDPQGQGYNVLQSMTAVGSGQWWGRGLALGSQSNLRFLPEPGTDFIFAVIAEDLGWLGAVMVLGLFAFIFYRLFGIMHKSSDDFGAYLVLGIASMLLVQIFINVGMNMGISPVTGIPLPLVSAGGSSLWTVMIALGMVHSVYIRNR
ncbi:MAG: rod shape-determining protein RodA [Patescibacteria group bacterium]